MTSVTTEAARKPDRGGKSVRELGEGEGDSGPPSGDGGGRRKIAATLVVGLVLMAAVGAVALATQAPPRVVRISYPGVKAVNRTGVVSIGFTTGAPTICQGREVLPSGISAVRVSVWGFFGPRVRLTAYQGSRLLTEGTRSGGWVGDSVTVPVKPVTRAAGGVRLCVALSPNEEPMVLLGANTPQAQAATFTEPSAPGETRTLNGRMVAEYLAAGHGSWWSRVVAVARHAGLGRALSGTWIALLILLLMVAIAGLTVGLILRDAP
ncbi:MAG TPA: hypothetical protein VL972_09230 [Solirubrobacteraceae bacterium]|nr:hypothetical protein [Solirubrobacteraceae bacterium]